MREKAIPVVVFAMALGLGVTGDLAECARIPLPAYWVPLLTGCHYVAILLGSFSFGLEIGLVAAVLVSVGHVTANMTACGEPISQQGEIAAFVVFGFVSGFLVKRRQMSAANSFSQVPVADADPRARGKRFHNPGIRAGGQIPVGFVGAVRASLSAMESAGSVLEDSALTDSNHREVAAVILKECHRLDVLIRLLEFGHVRPAACREVDLSSVLDEIIRYGEAITDVTLRKEESSGLRVVCDSELLEQSVLSLLGSAIRVAEPGDEIVLSAHADENGAVIDISNRRIGVLGQLGIRMAAKPEAAHRLKSAGVVAPLGSEGGNV